MLEYKNFIAIGKIVKPIGIKGNLKIISLTDFPERFNTLKSTVLYNEKERKFISNKFSNDYEFKISGCKALSSYINVKFDEIDNIEDAKELVNTLLMIDETHRVQLRKGSFYFYELTGCKVYDNNEYVGEVISIADYGSGYLFNVSAKGKEILLPFRDEFVRKIDITNKRIDVELIEGFLE